MKIDILRKELNNLIHLINRWEEQGYVPQIEKDIALARIQSLYITILGVDTVGEAVNIPPILNFSNNSSVEISDIAAEPKKIEESVDEEQVEIEVNESEVVDEEPEQVEQVEEEIEEAEVDEPEVADQEPEQEEQVEEDIEEAEVDEPEVIEEELEQEEQVDEEIEEEEVDEPEVIDEEPEQEEQVEDEPEQEEVSDLIESRFSYEQRVRFTHDLFCNDDTIFVKEMAKINKLGGFEEVLIYIGEYYRWSSDSKSAQEFTEIVFDKFNN